MVIRILNKRVPNEKRIKGYYYYELRHGDDWGKPKTVENSVRSNFYGTVVLPFEIDLTSKGYCSISTFRKKFNEIIEDSLDLKLQVKQAFLKTKESLE